MMKKSDSMVRQDRSDIKNLLATELALAVYSTLALVKIRHIMEAFDTLSPEEQVMLLGEETAARAKRYFRMIFAMIDLTKLDENYAVIPFAFSLEEAPLYLGFISQRYTIPGYDPEYLKQMPWEDYTKLLYQHIISGSATQSFCLIIKANFVIVVMDFSLYIFKMIFTKYLSQSDWNETLERVAGGKSHEANLGPRQP
jgi:hypothetical protein